MSLLIFLGQLEGRTRKRGRIQIRHLCLLPLIDENIAGPDISDVSSMQLEVPLGRNERIEQIPKVCLLEIIFFGFPLCYLIP